MKATGIVRRIDKLGRVVIPMEIRRVMRINDGDQLEIYTDDNQIMFQKYSTIENMGAAVKDILTALYRNYKMPVIACDKEKVVAAKGISSKEIINRRISDELSEIMKRRKVYVYDGNDNALCFPVDGFGRYAVACAPVIASGDIAGAILYLSADNAPLSPASETQVALVQVFASYLGEQFSD